MNASRTPEENRAYWNQRAAEHGASYEASWPDLYAVEIERKAIIAELAGIRRNSTVLDVGCANGHSTFCYATQFPKSSFVGIDNCENLLQLANARKESEGGSNLSFHLHDIRQPFERKSEVPFLYDFVLSTRMLINLCSAEEQERAVLHLAQSCKDTLILQEGVTDGLLKLNKLRSEVGLAPIEEPAHNRYLSVDSVKCHLAQLGFRGISCRDLHSTYYVISRVLKEKLRATPEGLAYLSSINEFASLLPNVGGYSTQRTMIFRRVEGI